LRVQAANCADPDHAKSERVRSAHLQAQAREILAVALRGDQRQHAPRRGLVLDDDPAVVTAALEFAEEGRVIDITLTQAAEDAVAQRGWVIPARCPRVLGNRSVTVLEVNVADALAEAPERLQRVSAAVRVVT